MDITRWDHHRQPDPEDPQTPLAWVFEREGRRVGKKPPLGCGSYHMVRLGRAHEQWYVHCSFAGALEFICRSFGEDNVEIDKQTGVWTLKVPENVANLFIGHRGSREPVVQFLKAMLELRELDIVPIKNVHRHRRK